MRQSRRCIIEHERMPTLALSFQDLILTLHDYWGDAGLPRSSSPTTCRWARAPSTPRPRCARSGPSRGTPPTSSPAAARPTAATARTPTGSQHYYQYQVILKPSPPDLQELYLGSLAAIGIDPLKHDIRFVEDDWESPTLGAWGLGWEVWCDGMEVTQFTYFQQIGGFDCKPVAGELTYGLERLAMYIQGVDNVFDLDFNDDGVTYGDVFLENEKQMSKWNFEVADTDTLFDAVPQGRRRMPRTASTPSVPIPAYEQAIKASHIFNLLQARGVISVAERQAYIGRVRDLAKGACAGVDGQNERHGR